MIVIRRVCPFCNKEFQTNNKQKFYCTEKCAKLKYYKKIKANKKEANVELFDWKQFNNCMI